MSNSLKRHKLNYLPRDTKAALIAKILANTETYQGLSQWLFDEYGIKVSSSAIWKFAKTVQAKHGGLLECGIPAGKVGQHLGKLETLGALLVQREVLNRQSSALLAAILEPGATTEDER